MQRIPRSVFAALLLAASCSGNTTNDVDGAAAQAAAAAEAQATDAATAGDGDASDTPSTAEAPATDSANSDAPIAEVVATGVPDVGAPAQSRIAVETEAGQIYLIDADGGNRVELSGADVQAARHPVWSPDGRRIGWSEVTSSGFAVTTTNADGTEKRRADTVFSGYFGSWTPTSSLLGYLGTVGSGTGLVLDQGVGTALDNVVDRDTFYYFSWSPDGSRWVVHGGAGMRIMSLDGTVREIELEAGRFRAPVWTPDGAILVAVATAEGSTIVRVDPDTTEVEGVLQVGDITNFVLDDSGRYLAVESVYVDVPEPDDGRIAQPQDEPELERAAVLVVDLQDGEVTTVWEGVTGGFWWSPDATSLAILVSDPERPGFARWAVWRASGAFASEPFRVTPNFAQGYVPFYDQFAQSISPWAPDSSRFVYAGIDESGQPGVFVQSIEPDTAAVRIADDGVIAIWSPT